MGTIVEYDSRFWELTDRLGARVSSSLKHLLEEKHLYQASEVELAGPTRDETGGLAELADMFVSEVEGAISSSWSARDKADRTPTLSEWRGISFDTPDVKLHCSACKRVEAFNSVSTVEISARGIHETRSDGSGRTIQVFALSFECQSCKGPPEVFIVRRAGSKLTLSGRAPIEHVDVPAAIPVSVKQWYSGAIVAHQSGQTLAGQFLLRTLIEQWAREATGERELQAVELLEQYKASLPADFKQRFPSLSDVYSRLSVDIHEARGSGELFEEAQEEIVKHFAARRLFDL